RPQAPRPFTIGSDPLNDGEGSAVEVLGLLGVAAHERAAAHLIERSGHGQALRGQGLPLRKSRSCEPEGGVHVVAIEGDTTTLVQQGGNAEARRRLAL